MANTKFSNFVFSVIDLAGFNDEIKSERIEMMKCKESFLSERFTIRYPSLSCISTGSTSEGTSPYSVTDGDTMIVLNDILCVEKANYDADTNSQINVLTAEYENMPPGYVKVAQGHTYRNTGHSFSTDCLFLLHSYWYGPLTDHTPYISNDFFKKYKLPNRDVTFATNRIIGDELFSFEVRGYKANGPAITTKGHLRLNNNSTSSFMFSFEFDVVLAIPFYSSSILNEWSSRSRRYDWPSEELIHDVSTMEGFIVPVGEKKSETEHIEWRISYVTTEKMLLKALNSSQYKLYVILKVFAKQVFPSVSKSFSSYMVKNVVLWMAEINASNTFTPSHFIDSLLQSLNFIKNCLVCNHLPNYIMPKKNLIAGRIVGHEKSELISFLSTLTDEGARVICRIPKLASCLKYASVQPDFFAKFGLWRHCVEKQILLLNCTMSSSLDPKENIEDSLRNVYFLLYNFMLSPDKHFIRDMMILLKLIIPDYLERFPNLNYHETTTAFGRRIDFVNNCCFLNNI